MMPRCFGTLFASFLAGVAGAQEPATLADVKQGHALELARLSDSCVEKKLLNDAGRLLGSALLLAPKEESLLERKKRLREVWISVNQDREKREVYKHFWRSDAYKKACAELKRREGKVRKDAMRGYLEIAGRAGKNDVGIADAAFRQAFEVDATSQVLASRAGAERMEKLRRERPGLAALQLGETVVGKPTDLKDLEGKVVLWRSFSL